jgi:hypothetical protein
MWKSPQSPRAKKAQQVRNSTKSMFIVLFDVKGIVHREFVPPKIFETVSDIQMESQVVLNSIQDNDFHGAFEAWKK